MFQDFKAPEKILYEPLFRSVESRLVKRCQGSCRNMLFLTGKEDYLVVKSRARISFMSKHGKMDSKCCPPYIHFKAECLMINGFLFSFAELHYYIFLFSIIIN